MSKLEFVIFDCDGVLVDSEYLSAQINANILMDYGFSISPNELAERYAGLVFSDILKVIDPKASITHLSNLIEQSRSLFLERIRSDLRPIRGVRRSIRKLHLPYCLCSNSTSASIKTMLTLTNLYDLFEGRIFSASEVGTGRSKPAPDVYLSAVEKYCTKPEKVVVLEDSVHGVAAAKAAGMRVVGFTGASHAWPGLSSALTKAGAETTISHHIDILSVIESMNNHSM